MSAENDIDLVYLWVNGNDPEWIAKRNAFLGREQDNSSVDCRGRYAENDELRHSLRSVEMYAPWIRKIFIVTDNQVPGWLDTSNPKIQIVDHKEIMPSESLPCFNSTLLEHYLHMIPGLSERFIYANDDMCLNQPVSPATFYASDGLPYIRQSRRPLRKFELWFRQKIRKKTLSNYNTIVQNAARLVEKKYGKYYGGKAHHNIDAYLKSSCMHTAQIFKDEIDRMKCNHVRHSNDVQRSLYSYAAMAEGLAHPIYVTQHTSFRLQIHKEKHYTQLERYNPIFFCMNDSEYAGEEDRHRATEFLQKRFPDKSSFEK